MSERRPLRDAAHKDQGCREASEVASSISPVLLTEQDCRDRVSYAELQAYRRGYADGVADTCVWQAELYSDEQSAAHWRETNRDLNLDRRDTRLIERIRGRVARGEWLDHHDQLVLYLADHPEVTFLHDPQILPGDRGKRRTVR